MLQTYKTTLRGDRLEWNDATLQALSDDQPIAVHVTILMRAKPHLLDEHRVNKWL